MGAGDPQPLHSAQQVGGRFNEDRLHEGAASLKLPGTAARTVQQHGEPAANASPVEVHGLGGNHRLQGGQPLFPQGFRHLAGQGGGRRTRPGAVVDGLGLGETDIGDQFQFQAQVKT